MSLVGGTGPYEGYLYATNPVTNIYGPVCDDYFNTNAVSPYRCILPMLKFNFFSIQCLQLLMFQSIRKNTGNNSYYFISRQMLYASSSNSMEQPLTLVAQAVGHWHRPPFLTMMSNALEQKQPLRLALISIPMTALQLKGFGLPAIQDLVQSFCLLPNYTGH